MCIEGFVGGCVKDEGDEVLAFASVLSSVLASLLARDAVVATTTAVVVVVVVVAVTCSCRDRPSD